MWICTVIRVPARWRANADDYGKPVQGPVSRNGLALVAKSL
jgi:hypothetical protein